MSDFGPKGTINPNRLEPKGNYFDPETGYAGMPAPPAESIAARRTREMTENWRRTYFHVAHNEKIEQFVAQKVIDGIAEGATAEDALAAVTAELLVAFPRPADERRWRADEEVRRLEHERRQRNMGLGVRPR